MAMSFKIIVFVVLFVSGSSGSNKQDRGRGHESRPRRGGERPYTLHPGPSDTKLHRQPHDDHRGTSDDIFHNQRSNDSDIGTNSGDIVIIKTIRNFETYGLDYVNGSYFYIEVGNTLEFTCVLENVTKIRWTDAHGFETEWVSDRLLILKLTADGDDVNLVLICQGMTETDPVVPIMKNVTITLKLAASSSNAKPKRETNKVPLEKGGNWNANSSCHGIIHKPGNYSPIYYKNISKIYQVIENFDKDQNGTEFSCIQYNKYFSKYNTKYKQNVTIFERMKTQTIFYLDDKTGENESKTSIELSTETSSQVTEESKNPPSSPAAIVGYILGAIVMVSVGVLLGIWYKSMLQRRETQDNNASQVIYTEIAEKATAPPPPPRNDTPYAKIIGTLVPNQQAPTENPYATILENGNPYATVQNPYVTVNNNCVLTEGPYATVN